jgi:hypothetical protein
MNDDTDVLDRIVRLTRRIDRLDHLRVLCGSGTTIADERVRSHLRRQREMLTAQLDRLRQEVADHTGGDDA